MDTKNICLPEDIHKYVRKKVVLCVSKFLIFEIIAAAICIYLFMWEDFQAKTTIISKCLLIVISVILPCYLSGFPIKLIDKTWSGVVTNVDIREEIGVRSGGGARVFNYTKHVVYLTVEKNNGKKSEIPVREFGRRNHKGFSVANEGDVRNHLNEYSIGDTVIHFYALKGYYVIKSKSDMIDCVICGTKNEKSRSECLECGYSLLKFKL